jgi:hypothetical protein
VSPEEEDFSPDEVDDSPDEALPESETDEEPFLLVELPLVGAAPDFL